MRIANSPTLMTRLLCWLRPYSRAASVAEAAIQAASRLRPDAGEAQLARALNLYWGYLDYDGALGRVGNYPPNPAQ